MKLELVVFLLFFISVFCSLMQCRTVQWVAPCKRLPLPIVSWKVGLKPTAKGFTKTFSSFLLFFPCDTQWVWYHGNKRKMGLKGCFFFSFVFEMYPKQRRKKTHLARSKQIGVSPYVCIAT
jgi:hypothetical protein